MRWDKNCRSNLVPFTFAQLPWVSRKNWVASIVRMMRVWSSFDRYHKPFLILLCFRPQKKLLENQCSCFFLLCMISLQEPINSRDISLPMTADIDLQSWSSPSLISNYLTVHFYLMLHLFTHCISKNDLFFLP